MVCWGPERAMSALRGSLRRGEYWATCLRVLSRESESITHCPLRSHDLLLGDAVQRAVIVEAKVAGVDDVVGFGVARKLVQLTQVA